MKKIEGSKHKLLKDVPYGYVAIVPGHGWVIVLKHCGLMNPITKNLVTVAIVDMDHIALLSEDLPAHILGPAEVGHGCS